MSPPAHPLLALACASLLAACSANARPDGQVYPGQCTTVVRGNLTNLTLSQPRKEIPAGDQEVEVNNDCWMDGLELVGEKVTACSEDAAPTVFMDTWPNYTPVTVSGTKPTQIYVEQECHVVIWPA